MNNTILTIPKKADKHRVKIKKGQDLGGFSTFIEVYLNDEKYPYITTCMADSTPLEKLIQWAKEQINKHPFHSIL